MAFNTLDKSKLSFNGWFVDGKLTAKIITSNKAGGSIGTPQLVPIGSGVSVGFNLNGSVTQSDTLDTVLDFAVSPIAESTEICDRPRAPGIRRVESLGIYQWLYSITQTAKGQPRIAATNLVYTLDFGVKREGTAGVDVAITPIKASASTTVSRDDIQQLTLKLSPGENAVKKAKKVLRTSGSAQVVQTSDEGDITIFGNDATIGDAETLRKLRPVAAD
jgi:hypothetical protein